MKVTYFIDGVDLAYYGVHISASDGLLSRPRPKKPLTMDWETHNGEVVDLSKKYFEARDISLNCFIKSTDNGDFLTKCNDFIALFDKTGTRRLMVRVDAAKPLVYEVYLSDAVNIEKKWHSANTVGTFSLKLREPEPIKMVLEFMYSETGSPSIMISTTKPINIYWGDGSHRFDFSGTDEIDHEYDKIGIYYIVITGNIDEITSLTSTNCAIVWNKL